MIKQQLNLLTPDFNFPGLWGPAIALIGLSYCPEGNMTFAVVMLTVAVGINAGQYVGYMVRYKVLKADDDDLFETDSVIQHIKRIVVIQAKPEKWSHTVLLIG